MKITTPSGKPFDIPPGTTLSIERPNPFFNQYGEQSLPITLPPSRVNLDLTGNVSDIASANKPIKGTTVEISEGIYQAIARQVILSANRRTGIQSSFYFNVGAFFAKLKDVTLKDLFKDEKISFSTVPAAVDYCRQAFTSYNPKFACLETIVRIGSRNYRINERRRTPSLGLFADEPRTMSINDTQVSLPVGYFVSPFIRLSHLLELMFSKLGYTFIPGILGNSPWSSIVLLNNNVDTILTAEIRYDQIIPECTVSTLLSVLRTKFCAEFIPDEVKKTVSFVTFNEVMDSTSDIDLTEFLTDTPTVEFPENYEQVRLISEVMPDTIYSASSSSMESAFTESVIAENSYLFNVRSNYPNAILDKSTGAVINRGIRGHLFSDEWVGSLRMPYYTGGTLKARDYSVDDIVPGYVFGFDSFFFLKVGNARMINSSIVSSPDDPEDTTEKKTEQLKPMLCFEISDSQLGTIGTVMNYSFFGEKMFNFTLAYNGSEGLFNSFWRQFDSILRNSLHKVRASMIIPPHIAMTIPPHSPVIINNQRLLPDIFKFAPGKNAPSESSFYTSKLHAPIQQTPEENYPTAHPYKWSIVVVKSHDFPLFLYDEVPVAFYPPPPTEEQYQSGGSFHVRVYPVKFSWQESEDGSSYITPGTLTVSLVPVLNT